MERKPRCGKPGLRLSSVCGCGEGTEGQANTPFQVWACSHCCHRPGSHTGPGETPQTGGKGAGTRHVWGRLWSECASAKTDMMGDSGQLTVKTCKKKPSPTGAHTEGLLKAASRKPRAQDQEVNKTRALFRPLSRRPWPRHADRPARSLLTKHTPNPRLPPASLTPAPGSHVLSPHSSQASPFCPTASAPTEATNPACVCIRLQTVGTPGDRGPCHRRASLRCIHTALSPERTPPLNRGPAAEQSCCLLPTQG